ncbi:MAG: 4'-phosphopantetheinyl transferase superfamily protein [Clostridia bacterium]|nr:4'-phosphopantetheinyl transferase superfamily protein [Clostridia bacterium]
MAVLIAVSTTYPVDAQQLSEARRAKAAQFQHPQDRALCLCAGWALDAALRTVGLRERTAVIVTGEHGKPFLSEYPRWHFNLSHSGDWAVCALSDAPIGVDIEQLRERDYLRLAQRHFSPDEVGALQTLSPTQQQERFFRLWTRKESWLKAQGIGLAGLSSAPVAAYTFREYTLSGYALTVCTCGAFPDALVVME